MPTDQPPGAARLDRLRADYSETEVQAYKTEKTRRLQSSGRFTQADIDAYWGDQPRQSPGLDNTVAHNVGLNMPNGADPKVASNPLEYIGAGWDMSVSGLIKNQSLPKTVLPEHAGFFEQMMYMLGQTAGDLPASGVGLVSGGAAGGAAGAAVPVAGETGASEAVGGVIGAGVGASAMPEGMRQVLVDHYKNGDFLSFEDFMKRSAKMSWETGKAGLIGGVSVLIGGKAGAKTLELTGSMALARITETTAMATSATAVNGALQGRIPNAEDFAAGAAVALGFHAAGSMASGGRKLVLNARGQQVQQNMMDIYARTGVAPWDQVARAKVDIALRQQIFSTSTNGRPVSPSFHAEKPHEPDLYHKPSGPGTPPDDASAAIVGLENSAAAAAAWNRKHPDRPITADDVVSPAGAVGKWQVMPDTARQYGFDPSRLRDPAYNEKVGKTILADLMRRYRNPDGSPDMASVYIAYNAGPGRANFFRANGRRLDKLPVETQRYLGRAARNGWLEPGFGKGGGGGGEEPPGGGGTGEGSQVPAKLPEEAAKMDRDSLQERILSLISKPEKPGFLDSAKDMIDRIHDQTVSELGPAQRLDERMLEDPNQLGAEDMFRSTLASGPRAGHFIRSGAFDPWTFKRLSDDSYIEGYRMAQKAGGTQEGLTAYRMAKRTLDLAERGLKSGVDVRDAAAFVKQTAKTYEPAARMIDRTKNGVLDYAEGSGLYSLAQINAMKAQNPSHIPFVRDIEGGWSPPGAASKRGFQSRQGLKKIKGSEKQIVDPVEAEINAIYRLVQDADRNRGIGYLVDPLGGKNREITPVQEFVVNYLPKGSDVETLKALPPGRQLAVIEKALTDIGIEKAKDQPEIIDAEFTDMTPEARAEFTQKLNGRLGPNDFIYYREGKPEVWTAKDPALAKMIRGGTPIDREVVGGVMRWFATIQRSGITTLPDYIAKMVFRDQFTTPIVDKFGGAPFQNLLIGAMHVIRGDEHYLQFVRSGGMGSALADMDANYIRRDVDAVFTKTGTWGAVVNSVTHPIEAMRLAMERVDAMSRLGYYSRQVEAGFDPLKGAMRARKAYLDFAERGTSEILNWWAGVTPFLRPTILGIDQLVTAIKTNPVGMAVKGAGYITVPSVALWIMNYIADQGLPDDEKYENLPRWQRDLFWITPPIGGVRIRLPKPRELGMVFGSLPERMLEQWVKDDPRAFKDWASNFLGLFAPNLIPALPLPIIEQVTNHSFYQDRPLQPASLEGASNYMQYTPSTTETAKAISRVLGPPGMHVADVSPIVLENYAKQWAGTAGTDVLRILNVPTQLAPGHKPVELADLPFVSSFVVRNDSLGAAPIQDFYDELDKVTTAHKDLKLAVERNNAAELDFTSKNIDAYIKLTNMATAMGRMRQALQGIQQSKDMTDDEKRQQSEDIYTGMLQIAKSGTSLMDTIHASSEH